MVCGAEGGAACARACEAGGPLRFVPLLIRVNMTVVSLPLLQQIFGSQEETSHTHSGNQEKTVYCTPVLAQQSHLQSLSPEPWHRPPFMVGMVGSCVTKEKREGALISGAPRTVGGQLVDTGGKPDYRNQKHARGVSSLGHLAGPFYLVFAGFSSHSDVN